MRKGPTLLGSLVPQSARLAYRHRFWRAQGGVPTSLTWDERRKLADLADGQVVLEVGSQYGASTIALAATAEIVFAVDHHRGDPVSGEWDTLGDFLAELDRHGVYDKVVPVVGRLEQVMTRLAPGGFGLVFIDAGKETVGEVRDQAQRARVLVAPGGKLAFHDVGRFPVIDEALSSELGEPLELVDTLAVYELLN